MSGRYFEWNEAIVREYFPEDNPSAYAYLPLDDDEIVALAEEYGICESKGAVADFENAVKVELNQNSGSFACLSRWAKYWRTGEANIPPYVAGLAFCVLAASRMRGDEELQVTSGNYYVWLNRMLGREESGIPPNFRLLKIAWEDLSTWLDDDCRGSRGQSTVRTLEQFRHIGYPLSQCLLKSSDRRRLPDFFKTRGLRNSDALEIGSERLFQLLKSWAARPGSGLSGRAKGAIASTKDRGVDEIVETVRRELESWDGSLRDARGKRRYSLRVRLMFKKERSSLGLYAELPPGFVDGSWRRSDNGQEVEIKRDPASLNWSDLIPIPIGGEFLRDELSLASDDVALVWKPMSAIPFRAGDGPFSDWLMSQLQAAMGEVQFALVRRDLEFELERYLNRQISGTIQSFSSAKAIPGNWTLLGPFKYQRQPQTPPLEFSQFGPRSQQSMSLRGGLPLGNELFVSGGEPDLSVAFDESNEKKIVTIDEVEYQSSDEFFQLALSKLKPSLTADEPHEIRGDVTRTITAVRTMGDVVPLGAGSLGHSLRRHTDYHPDSQMAQPTPETPSRGQVVISGATLTGDPADLPSVRRDPLYFKGKYQNLFLIGRSVGEIAQPTEINAPRWMNEAGLESQFQFVEVRFGFNPLWILEEDTEGKRCVKKLERTSSIESSKAKPGDFQAWFEAVFRWESAIPLDPDAAEDWAQFVSDVHGGS